MTSARKCLTYANVMATVAVFLALGGGAYAMLRLPPRSVGNRQLRSNAVSGAKVKNGSLTGVDIATSSLTGENIAPASLNGSNIGKLGLANLLGASGTAINDGAVQQASGTCGRYEFSAPGAQPGDGVMLGGSDAVALDNALVAAPTVANPNKLKISVCAGQGNTIDQAAGTIQLRFDTLR